MSCFIMSPESIRTLGNTLDSVFNAAKYSNIHSITTAAVCNTSLCRRLQIASVASATMAK